MTGFNFKKLRAGLALILLIAASLIQAQVYAQTAKKPIGYDVYDSWKSIQGTRISDDGRWLVYSLVPGEGDSELVVLELQTGKETRYPRGKEAVITPDNQFVIYTIAPPKIEVDKAKKEKKKSEEQPKNGLGIINLKTGELVAVDRVKSFKVAEDSGNFVAYLLEAPVVKEAEKDKVAKRKKLKPVRKKRKNLAKNRLKSQRKRKPTRKKSQEQNWLSASWRPEKLFPFKKSQNMPGVKTAATWLMLFHPRSPKKMELLSMNQPPIKPLPCSKARATM